MTVLYLADECCYWYTAVPGECSCSVDPYPVSVPCGIVNRHDPQTNVSVRWYWSGDQEAAGVRGTLLTNSSKYSLLINLAVTSLPNKSALFNDYYTLIIQNFATSDFGYYWCQIVVNDTCLLLHLRMVTLLKTLQLELAQQVYYD